MWVREVLTPWLLVFPGPEAALELPPWTVLREGQGSLHSRRSWDQVEGQG
jgi:hypothetical protein